MASADTSGSAGAASERQLPKTARGARTRARLVAAARQVFERDGYLDSRIADITKEADSAAGSFYSYFDSKDEIFRAVLDEVQEEMLHPHLDGMSSSNDPLAVIEASNRAYLVAYQRNAKLMRLLEQVATIDDDFRELRKRRSDTFMRRNARVVRELQARGLADPSLNPLLAAGALSGMVSRMAYTNWVLGENWELEELADTLTRIWANALRIPQGAPGSPPGGSRS
ncbi:TetR/AcrR family transcriptional regulator [Blastococcus sp. BMG 814]|uniref:TetR/AcrR family transcriptional regulator n=1 Tax=Blastococcus carthaginiensis TaxID=3050034 RepID=A0ABT9I6B4_9ACTN|nr:TetR/AcrR family transcriptional regulator [Blastococcus carthaginiensis]MDP5181098.1 TetR/AcrR family transcriptional regulator [Blastococcus carthaginiensis]